MLLSEKKKKSKKKRWRRTRRVLFFVLLPLPLTLYHHPITAHAFLCVFISKIPLARTVQLPSFPHLSPQPKSSLSFRGGRVPSFWSRFPLCAIARCNLIHKTLSSLSLPAHLETSFPLFLSSSLSFLSLSPNPCAEKPCWGINKKKKKFETFFFLLTTRLGFNRHSLFFKPFYFLLGRGFLFPPHPS